MSDLPRKIELLRAENRQLYALLDKLERELAVARALLDEGLKMCKHLYPAEDDQKRRMGEWIYKVQRVSDGG